MRRILLALLLTIVGISPIFSQTRPLRGTAEYYLEAPDRYLDKSVTLYIIEVKEMPKLPAPENYTAFFAFTTSPAGDGSRGGGIIVYVRDLRAKQFAKKYKEGWIVNGKPKTGSISGKFIKALEVDGYAVKMN